MYEECNGAEKYYFYDSNGTISGIRYFDANGTITMIYVVTNSQGDVIALYDKNGNAVVEYQYDAWGNIISVVNSTEGSSLDWNEINPFRYRGYVYDSDTGLYYLQSRYYDAETGRFINADSYFSTGTSLLGFNMFAYCDNNPVMKIDVYGNLAIGINLNVNINLIFGASFSIGFVVDDNFNVDIQYTYAVTGFDDTISIGVADVGAGVSVQVVNVDTVYDLYGPSTTIGFSVGASQYVGVDVISLSKIAEPDEDIDGVQVSFGIGAGFDFHIVQSNTKPLYPQASNYVTNNYSNRKNYRILTFKEKFLGGLE